MVIIKKVVHFLSWIAYLLIGTFVLIGSPIIFGYKPLVVLTGSMKPTYKVGSVIYYHKVAEDKLKVGDAITYEVEDDTLVTHRIFSIENGQYETKGDANDSPDPYRIEYKNIKGKVAKISIPVVGKAFVFFLRHHTVIIGILILILVSEFLVTNLEIFDIEGRKLREKGLKKNEREKS